MAVTLLVGLLLAEGPPLFYWGARPAVITVEAAECVGPDCSKPPGASPEAPATDSVSARVQEVHAALDRGALVLRFTFDRSVREAKQLPDGSPVSGRLRATLYLDRDADRATGLEEGPTDLRTGADLRLEVGVITVGEDAEEGRKASALITATLAELARDGRRKTLWRGDEAANPRQVSARGDWLELRLPSSPAVAPGARLILAQDGRALDGRLGR
jgi:hypothetical protein